MAKYKNLRRLGELKKHLHVAYYAIAALEVCKCNDSLAETCTKLEGEFAESMKHVVDIMEEAAEEHREWLDAEFGDEAREEKHSRRNRLEAC